MMVAQCFVKSTGAQLPLDFPPVHWVRFYPDHYVGTWWDQINHKLKYFWRPSMKYVWRHKYFQKWFLSNTILIMITKNIFVVMNRGHQYSKSQWLHVKVSFLTLQLENCHLPFSSPQAPWNKLVNFKNISNRERKIISSTVNYFSNIFKCKYFTSFSHEKIFYIDGTDSIIDVK